MAVSRNLTIPRRHTEVLLTLLVQLRFQRTEPLILLLLLSLWELSRLIVRLAVQFLYFIPERRAVVLLGIRQSPRLPLVVPIIGRQTLGFFEVGNRVRTFAGLVEIFSQSELDISRRAFRAG